MSISSLSVRVREPVVRGCVVWCEVGWSRMDSLNALMLRAGVEWWDWSGEYMFHSEGGASRGWEGCIAGCCDLVVRHSAKAR